MKKLLIADGTNIMYRSFYGIRPLTNQSGLHTNAVYGCVTTLSKAVEDIKPDSVAVAFDLPTPTFRHKSYDGYKATRKKAPDDLTEQIEYVRRTVNALGLHAVDCEGYEADDILGTLSVLGEKDGYEVYILTGDRDVFQLITDKTVVVYISNTGHIIYDRAAFREKYNAEPPIMVDIKALMGDSSDNIPGVAGIGEKTALKLISECGTLEGVYHKLQSGEASFSPSVTKKLIEGRESALLSYDLARIRCDAPISVTPASLSYEGFDRSALRALFAELGFFKLSERFGLSDEDEKVDDASGSLNIPKPTELTSDDIASFNAPPAVAVDESTIYIAKDDKIYYTQIDGEMSQTFFKKNSVVCHDYKALYGKLSAFGIESTCAFDTFLSAYLLSPGESSYELPRVSMTYLSENINPKNAAEEAYVICRIEEAQRKALIRVDEEAEVKGSAKLSDVLYSIEIP
ncbi:MAG: hypothetical protein LUH54_00870, partial [Firmicutes bacterium]|nr:hypothetical protein [Bacillota bacterium]